MRYTHFGEGKYTETEEVIQKLLKESGSLLSVELENNLNVGLPARGQTPETYLGYERAERFANQSELSQNSPLAYTLTNDLKEHEWSLGGKWQINDESGQSLSDSSTLRINYSGKEVYLVMSGPPGALVTVQVDGLDTPGGSDVNESSTVSIDKAKFIKVLGV